ncbi:ParE toxin of type II toxin-antitoxin system, parDE [Pseudobutyrivibrio sp. 49]|uniref:type II toxin-antitoxin system RelE/ParE family toxin n=1 Tax=Pseudobutyrivibrio sp. 49 TaxID=1855344 RepID=UPI00088805D5|nr:type II toxin-antitoxin system RelE/ParE family toxin [Pseudobutyrivibrio sp. 49]SDI78003.1 ParE toxin of type II toxin-antitoxin system, parDE [Pseudobutyrivibrio sp. 49]
MALKNYSLTFAKSALEDQIELKTYILEHFMYEEYGDNFDAKMKSAALYIKNTASSIRPTSFYYRGYVIYMLVHKSYLFFYVVNEDKAVITVLRILNDGRDWMSIIKKWLRKNGTEK